MLVGNIAQACQLVKNWSIYIDQRTACGAPVHWSKYTTHDQTNMANLNRFKARNTLAIRQAILDPQC